jgi:hypothetical protein
MPWSTRWLGLRAWSGDSSVAEQPARARPDPADRPGRAEGARWAPSDGDAPRVAGVSGSAGRRGISWW